MRGGRRAVGAGALAAVVGFEAACLIDVDESLLDRRAATVDAGGPREDAPDVGASEAAVPGMPCGTSVCSPLNAICCTGRFSETDRTKGACVPASRKDTDCQSGDWWECMRPSDCAGGASTLRCCANAHTGGGFSKALCGGACDATATELCDPSAPSPCAGGGRCIPSPGFPGLYECTRS